MVFRERISLSEAVLVLLVRHHRSVLGTDFGHWLYLTILGVFCTGLSQYLFVKSLDVLEARSAGMIIALEPVYVIAGAWILLADQPPSLRTLLGAGLIVFATVVPARGKSVESSAH